MSRLNISYVQPSKRFKLASKEELHKISGTITEIVYPPNLEVFSGFAKVKIGSRLVVGSFPFLEMHFKYHLLCSFQQMGRNAVYRIVDYQDPPFTPVQLTPLSISVILQTKYGIDQMVSLKNANELRERLCLKQLDDKIDYARLAKITDIEWLNILKEELLVFKFEYLKNLGKFWDHSSLVRQSVATLCSLASDIQTEPEKLFFSWQNSHNLDELRIDNLRELGKMTGKQFPDEFKLVLMMYQKIKKYLRNNFRLSFDITAIKDFSRIIPYAIKTGVITPKFHVDPSGQGQRLFYVADTLEHLNVMQHRIAELLANTEEVEAKSKEQSISKMTKRQREVYHHAMEENMLLILGDPGTGKTATGKYIFDRFKKKHVLPLACYGRVAAAMKRKYGKGYTVDKVVTYITKGTIIGKKLAKDTQCILIDEISTMDLRKFVALLQVYPNLRKLIMMGDNKQMRPVEPGAILEPFLKKYLHTPVVQRLHDLLRIGEDAVILKENLDKIWKGDSNLDYSTDLHSNHPFIIIERAKIPLEVERSNNTERELQLISPAFRTLFQVHPADTVLLLTQRNRERHLLNRCVYDLSEHSKNQFNANQFYTGEKAMITENFYTGENNTKLPPQLKSDDFMNGDIEQIQEIYDVDPSAPDEKSAQRIPVNSTHAPKKYEHFHRIVVMRSGKRMDLLQFKIANMSKGNASTIAQSQGSEEDIVCLFLHDRISSTFYLEEFLTAISRLKKRGILITPAAEGRDPLLGLVEKILKNRYPESTDFVHDWFPDYFTSECS